MKSKQLLTVSLALGLLPINGCLSRPSPITSDTYSEMRSRMLAQQESLIVTEVSPIELSDQLATGQVEALLQEIDRLASTDADTGAHAYRQGDWPVVDAHLWGRDLPSVNEVTLRRSVLSAALRRLEVQNARYGVDAAHARIIQAEARFDITAYGETGVSLDENRRPEGSSPGISGLTQTDTYEGEIGLRRQFNTGMQAQISGSLTQTTQNPSIYDDGSWYESDLRLQITQNLGRGFDRRANLAVVEVADIQLMRTQAEVRQAMIEAASESALRYWELQATWDKLRIEFQLFQRTQAIVERLAPRTEHDLTPADLAQVLSELESRRIDLLETAADLRDLSDQLKRLMHDPELPVIGEATLAPQDYPEVGALELDLAAAVRSGLLHRPELAVALAEIQDAEVRHYAAEDALKPLIELTAGMTLQGFDEDDVGQAISEVTGFNQISADISLRFEQALANREARARAFELNARERQAVLNYEQQTLDIIIEIKQSMREVILAYEILASTRSSRRAAAESLRLADRLLQDGTAQETFTTQIDRVLNRQNQLARAEIAESEAYARLMRAIVRLDFAMGTTLERYGLESLPSSESSESPEITQEEIE